MRVTVMGAGAVGARAARQLVGTESIESVLVHDPDHDRLGALIASIGSRAEAEPDPAAAMAADAHVVVLCGPTGVHGDQARTAIETGAHVVSTADSRTDVESLLALDAEARARQRTIVAGAGFAPGLTDVLAALAARDLDRVVELQISRAGTGGPACARQHHRALSSEALDWRDGGWYRRPGGSGRELAWFPDPIGGRDCYRAGLSDAVLLHPVFPDLERITARVAATRRDRITARLPMLRRPHPEGGPGAIRVEARGWRGDERDAVVLGAMDRPAVAAGAVAAVAAVALTDGRITAHGTAGLAGIVEPGPFLADLARRGVKTAKFEGIT